jgi:hypothetical protein
MKHANIAMSLAACLIVLFGLAPYSPVVITSATSSAVNQGGTSYWAANRPAAGGPHSLPTRLFPVDNWWNEDISSVPVDLQSASLLAPYTGSILVDWGDIYGIPYVTVSGNHPKVEFAGGTWWDESDHIPYPIPSQAITEVGWTEQLDRTLASNTFNGDRHLVIVDVDNQFLYEIYQPFYNATGSTVTFGGSGSDGPSAIVQPGQYYCQSAAFWDMKTNNTRPDGWTSSDAAGLQVLPGLVQYDEVFGEVPITHAHRVTFNQTANYYVWPATHKAWNGGTIPLGTRLRLKASYDITRGGQNGVHAQKLLKAFQTYGLIVADNGPTGMVQGTNDPRWGSNDYPSPKVELNIAVLDGHLKISDFEIVTLGWSGSTIKRLAAPKNLRILR